MKKLSDAKKSVLGNMIIRQTMGGLRKEDDCLRIAINTARRDMHRDKSRV